MTTMLRMTILIASMCVAVLANAAHDSKLALQIRESWRGYQDIVVTGTVKFYRNDELEEEKKFKAIYGHSDGKSSSRPFTVGSIVPNPGEPHIQDAELFDVCCSVSNGLVGLFRRRFVSQPDPSFVFNDMQMFPGDIVIGSPSHNDCCAIVHSALHPSFLSSGAASSSVANSGQRNTYWEIEAVGTEEFQGISAKRVRVTTIEPHLPQFLGVQFELLIAMEPSVLVLKFIDAKGGKDDSFRKNMSLSLKCRELLEVRNWNGRLIPVVTKFEYENVNTVVEVTDVSSIPSDFHGLWEFDGPTGTQYAGDLEPAVRKSGIHERDETANGRSRSVIPYSLVEQERIRQFLVGKKIIKTSGVSWTRLMIYAVNLIAIGYIALFAWYRIRQNS